MHESLPIRICLLVRSPRMIWDVGLFIHIQRGNIWADKSEKGRQRRWASSFNSIRKLLIFSQKGAALVALSLLPFLSLTLATVANCHKIDLNLWASCSELKLPTSRRIMKYVWIFDLRARYPFSLFSLFCQRNVHMSSHIIESLVREILPETELLQRHY
jgi:hypothetical protein